MMHVPLGVQIRSNVLALVSVVIALSALFYTTWRNESTEANRNIRVAEFEMLKYLAEVQQIVDYAHFRKDMQRGDLAMGLSRILLIHDLSLLTPKPVAEAAEHLQTVWVVNTDKLMTDLPTVGLVSEEILQTRRVVLDSLRHLK
jgi:hypothetical protein